MKESDTTRYLCAAAQLDSVFRTQVIDKILYGDYRAISVPAGVDLLSVAKHCLDASRRKLIRNIIASILFVIGWISIQGEYIDGLESIPSGPIELLSERVFSLYFSFWFLIAWLVASIEIWITRYRIISKNLLKNTYNPDCVKLFADTDEDLNQRFSKILNEEECNVVVYSGFSPFVGSGIEIGGWSFSVNTSRGKKEIGIIKNPNKFTIEDLYSRVDSDIKKLNLRGISIQDKIFVHGQEIRENHLLLPDIFKRPIAKVSPIELSKFIGSQSDITRHYKCIRIIGWKGEIIFSTFLRFVQLPQNLFIEASYFLLTPLKEEYREIDEIQPKPTWRQLVKIPLEAFIKSIFLYPGSIFLLLGEVIRPISQWWQRRTNRRLVRENPMFDYGALTSIRELASSGNYRHYFQKLDKEMVFKIISTQILDSITDYLDAHNIDTSELRSRQDTILNNGVIVTGGDVSAQNLTVGNQAKTAINTMTQAISSVAGRPVSSKKNK